MRSIFLRGALVASLATLHLGGSPAAAQPQPDGVQYEDYQRSSIYVPVRDSTRLAINVYRPANGGEPADTQLPVIFVATPYRARFFNSDGDVEEMGLDDRLGLRSLIRAGYVVAVADVRGKGASFGARRGFNDRTEANDSYDLIEWLAAQDYTTDNVGMLGCSYLGATTLQAATAAPPSLRAIFAGATDLDKYGFVRRGGITAQFNTRPDELPEIDLASVPLDADTNGQMLREAVGEHAGNTPMAALWYGMPYRDSVSDLTGNAFWEEVAVYAYLDAIREAGIATYFWGNWQDEPTDNSILSAQNLGGKLLVGPGGHCVPPPGFDLTGELVKYFDHYLKGVDNGIEQEPRATYWVEGEGWVRSDSVPGASATPQMWYLNGGTLGAQAGEAGQDSFTVDYDLPPAEYFAFWAKPMDAHGLSYTGQPLAEPLRLVGYPVFHADVSSSTSDANVFVYLDEIDAEGNAEVISFGRLALSHRALAEPPYDTLGLPWHSGLEADVAPLAVGEVAELDIVLTPISRVIPVGHSLRVTIAGADPRQRNLQEIRQDPAPVLTIRRGGSDSSARIALPVSQE